MPSRKYAIEPNGPKRLEVSWTGMWNEFTVKLDDQVVGTVSKDELKAGKELPLPDGSRFKAHLRRIGLNTELALERNGVPLQGSSADPEQLVKTAGGIVYFVAGLQVVVGLLAVVGKVELLVKLGIGIDSIVIGGVMGVLGFFTMQKSRIALGLAMVLFVLGMVLTIVTAIDAGGTPPVGGIVARVLFLTAMWRGFQAMGQLKKKDETASSGGGIAAG